MKYDGTNFDKVVEMHEEWIKNGMHGNPDNPDVSCADFSCMTIKDIECKNHNLSFAIFLNTKIYKSNFLMCMFTHADFTNTEINYASFWLCDMSHAMFYNARLYNTCFDVSELTFTAFSNASFYASVFDTSYIENVSALVSAKNVPNIPMACPDSGSFIGWKKVCLGLDLEPSGSGFIPKMVEKLGIAKLLIPEDAKRSSATGRKCRCDKAKVLEIQDMNGNVLNNTIARSFYDNDFIYIAGKMIAPTLPFEENRWEECASGIHFFISREEAVNYGG